MHRSAETLRRRRFWVLLIPALFGTASAQAAGVYKWVDRQGVIRYDDYSLLAERLTRASIARGGVAADAKATVPAEFVAEVARQCGDLKERAAAYAEARAVYGRDPVGNQYRLSANQVALEVARLRQDSARYCRPLAAQYLLADVREMLRQQQAVTPTVPLNP